GGVEVDIDVAVVELAGCAVMKADDAHGQALEAGGVAPDEEAPAVAEQAVHLTKGIEAGQRPGEPAPADLIVEPAAAAAQAAGEVAEQRLRVGLADWVVAAEGEVGCALDGAVVGEAPGAAADLALEGVRVGAAGAAADRGAAD